MNTHFKFGENWREYSRLIDEDAISSAVEGLAKFVEKNQLSGKSFLDIGCGSGLHSLAAIRMGASRLVAFDTDPLAVETTVEVLRTHAPGSHCEVRIASILDEKDLEGMGTFDVAYSWGVLHHTGSLREAIRNAAMLVKTGGLFVFALYRKTYLCDWWTREKRWYSRASARKQEIARNVYVNLYKAHLSLRGMDFQEYLANYPKSGRGMDFFHDVHDWMGGYPYESISPDEVGRRMDDLGFLPVKHFLLKNSVGLRLGLFGSACDEYVFRRAR